MWACWKALLLTLSDVTINCNCFSDWDYSLLVPNEVYEPYLTLWIAYYLNIGNHMTKTIFVLLLEWSWCPHVCILFLLTPLSLNMLTYFLISASAWGQARSKLGGVDTSILHHALYQYLLHYGLLLHFISHYSWLFSLILQGLPWRGGMPAAGILAGKGANIANLFCTAPKILKLHGSHFWN